MDNTVLEGKASVFGLLPSIDELLSTKAVIAMIAELGRTRTLFLTRQALDSIRGDMRENSEPPFNRLEELTREILLEEAIRRLKDAMRTERTSGLRRVINATGVVIHTNLGRAPLSENAKRAIVDAAGYSTIEYNIGTGKRGTRCSNTEKLLAEITGAESALIVNNCAAAAVLVLSVFAKGGDVLVSRGELVEIGGDFRIPDVLTQSGATLKEVGTTNRTKLSDYETALNLDTALILRVHPSNYRIVGFTDKPSVADLADLAHTNGILLYEDAGSGAMIDLNNVGLDDDPVISQSLAAGADIVSFSGDKLLGGPQAGLIVGRKDLIDRLRKHPLYRALRVDKLICAALEATLTSYARETAREEIPVLKMLLMSAEAITKRAHAFKARLADTLSSSDGLNVETIPGNSAVGGGAAPDVSPETLLLALTHTKHSDYELEQALRLSNPPVITRIVEGKVLIDLRTIAESDEDELIEILRVIN
ncbi:MAG: L-seryl-tRNA(Sec) selenium transferase [Pyrinomonadaceae bacterium]